MSIESEPATKAPWPPHAENDTLFRYPKPYPLKKGGKENLAGIAKDHSVESSDFLTYNFQTTKPKEINWYLAKYWLHRAEPWPRKLYVRGCDL
jgi:hypothetical protein